VEARLEESEAPHFEICCDDKLWAALCSRDKSLSFCYVMIGCEKVNNKLYNKFEY